MGQSLTAGGERAGDDLLVPNQKVAPLRELSVVPSALVDQSKPQFLDFRRPLCAPFISIG